MSVTICEEPIRLEDKLVWRLDDGRYLRLGARRIGGLYLPAFYITERVDKTGRYTRRRRFYLCVHITTRYCARPGAKTRNISVDVYYCVPIDQLSMRVEYERWLRKRGELELIGLYPPTTQRRRVAQFWREKVRELQRRALQMLDQYLCQFFGCIHCALVEYYRHKGEERREEYMAEREMGVIVGPPVAVYIAAYVVYKEEPYKVKGEYCRCDVSGTLERCNRVPPWEYYVLE